MESPASTVTTRRVATLITPRSSRSSKRATKSPSSEKRTSVRLGSKNDSSFLPRYEATSPSDTKPTSTPEESTTGTPLVSDSAITRTTSRMGASDGTLTGLRSMAYATVSGSAATSDAARAAPARSFAAFFPGLSLTSAHTTTNATTKSAVITQNARCWPRYCCSSAPAWGASMGDSADMDTRSAVPNAPAIWLSVLDTPWACWMTLLSSELTPQVFSGVIMVCKPTTITV